MRETRHLGATLCNLINIRKTNQIEVARIAGISQSGVNYLIQGRRPTANTLESLCHAWDNPADGITLLIEHLRDEIERANYKSESITIVPRDGSDQYDQLMDTLINAARLDPDIYALLADLAKLITHSKIERQAKTLDMAAEETDELYTAQKKKTATSGEEKRLL